MEFPSSRVKAMGLVLFDSQWFRGDGKQSTKAKEVYVYFMFVLSWRFCEIFFHCFPKIKTQNPQMQN